MYTYMYVYIYIYTYIYIYICPGGLPSKSCGNQRHINGVVELCHLYPYPCPKKFYKLPAVLFSYTNLFYKLAWARAWV